jgi:large subunit ribosomal protein L9
MTDVKVILRADVSGLGKRGDIVEVTKGYARNFLAPRSLAFKATDGATAQADAMRRSRDVKDAKDREGAEDIAKVLVARTIEIPARVGSGGRLFGSVTSSEVAEAVLEQTGIELDRKDLHMEEHIKDLGTHHVFARLHTDVQFPITVEVVKG